MGTPNSGLSNVVMGLFQALIVGNQVLLTRWPILTDGVKYAQTL